MLGDLVATGDTQVNAAFANERRDVSGGEEDQRDGEVLDEGDVEAGFAAELDVAAGKEVKGGLLEAALFLNAIVLASSARLCFFCSSYTGEW